MSANLNQEIKTEDLSVFSEFEYAEARLEESLDNEAKAMLAAIKKQMAVAAEARRALHESDEFKNYLKEVAKLEEELKELPLQEAEELRRIAGADIGPVIQELPESVKKFDPVTLTIRPYEAETLQGRHRIYNDMAEAYLVSDTKKFWELDSMLPERINDNMPLELKAKISSASSKADDNGEKEIEDRLKHFIPISLWMLEHIKESEGTAGLLEYNFNMIEAEEKYGKAWFKI